MWPISRRCFSRLVDVAVCGASQQVESVREVNRDPAPFTALARFTSFLLWFSACGSTSEAPDGGTACAGAGRSCSSLFGVYQVVTSSPEGCTANLIPALTFSSFDAGAGSVTWQGRVMQATRQDCTTVLPMGLGSSPVEFIYDPTCDTFHGTLNRCCQYPDGGRDTCTLLGTK